jgi:putative cardiolipin synthase
VQVRVLMDDSFTASADQALLAIDQHPGVEIRVYNPYKRRSDQAAMRVLLNLGDFGRLDHRMHNKILAVDRQVAIIGGRNMADHYFGLHAQSNFRDMELLLGGPVAGKLTDSFDGYWNNPWSFPIDAVVALRESPGQPAPAPLTGGELAEHYPPQTAQGRADAWLEMLSTARSGQARLIVDEPASTDPDADSQAPRQLGEALLREIDRVQRELWLISAYLIPTPELENALERAVDRGVRVRILTNSLSSNNHVTAHSAYQKHLHALLSMGVEVYELRDDADGRAHYMERPVGAKSLCLHAKLMVLDSDRVFVGSANLDPRSLNLNTEVGLLIDGDQVNGGLRQLLQPDFTPDNAWRLSLDEAGDVTWTAGDRVSHHAPGDSFMRRLEEWLLEHLPLEAEM